MKVTKTIPKSGALFVRTQNSKIILSKTRHHSKSSMLNLCCSQMLEAGWITWESHQTTLGEAQGVEKSQRPGHTGLLLQHQRSLWCIKTESALVILGENTCTGNLLGTSSSRTNGNHTCCRSRDGHTAHCGMSLALRGSRAADWSIAVMHSVWSSKCWCSNQRHSSRASCQSNDFPWLNHGTLTTTLRLDSKSGLSLQRNKITVQHTLEMDAKFANTFHNMVSSAKNSFIPSRSSITSVSELPFLSSSFALCLQSHNAENSFDQLSVCH